MALHQRITAEECIQQYDQAARESQGAGRFLLANGFAQGVASMAFSTEMLLKAAYFRFIGFSPTQRIEMSNLRDTAADVIPLGVSQSQSGDYHNLLFWAEAIIAVHREGLPARTRVGNNTTRPYPAVTASPVDNQDAAELRRCVGRLMENWSISDRYKSIQSLADQQDMHDVQDDVSVITRLYDERKV